MLGAVRARAWQGSFWFAHGRAHFGFFGPYANAFIRVTVLTLDVSTSWCTASQSHCRSFTFQFVGSDGHDSMAHCHVSPMPLLRGGWQHTAQVDRLVAAVCQFICARCVGVCAWDR